jgi:hypothetical protein
MTVPELSPLLLAEQLPEDLLHDTYDAAQEQLTKYPHEVLERDFTLGGLSLDLALHPSSDEDAADAYFDDAMHHWQRTLEVARELPHSSSISATTELLLSHIPAFMARKQGVGLTEEVWDELDFCSAGILETVLDDPDTPLDIKNMMAARIGTHLLCGTVSMLTFPSTNREAHIKSGIVRRQERDNKQSHPLYVLEGGRKVPLQARMTNGKARGYGGLQVAVPFGALASEFIRTEIPEIAETHARPGIAGRVAARWLIDIAKDNLVDTGSRAVIDKMAINVGGRVDAFKPHKW